MDGPLSAREECDRKRCAGQMRPCIRLCDAVHGPQAQMGSARPVPTRRLPQSGRGSSRDFLVRRFVRSSSCLPHLSSCATAGGRIRRWPAPAGRPLRSPSWPTRCGPSCWPAPSRELARLASQQTQQPGRGEFVSWLGHLDDRGGSQHEQSAQPFVPFLANATQQRLVAGRRLL